MEILFEDQDFAEVCNSDKSLVRKYNRQRARLIRRRLDDLGAAPNLSVMRSLPGRCHELKGDRAGQLSIDLDGPYRLIFRPADLPAPFKPDGGLDWAQVTAVTIVEVVDTHE